MKAYEILIRRWLQTAQRKHISNTWTSAARERGATRPCMVTKVCLPA